MIALCFEFDSSDMIASDCMHHLLYLISKSCGRWAHLFVYVYDICQARLLKVDNMPRMAASGESF